MSGLIGLAAAVVVYAVLEGERRVWWALATFAVVALAAYDLIGV